MAQRNGLRTIECTHTRMDKEKSTLNHTSYVCNVRVHVHVCMNLMRACECTYTYVHMHKLTRIRHACGHTKHVHKHTVPIRVEKIGHAWNAHAHEPRDITRMSGLNADTCSAYHACHDYQKNTCFFCFNF